MKLFAIPTLSLILTGIVTASPVIFKRAISDVPAGAQCEKDNTAFNDFQIEDAAQRAVDNRNGPSPGGYPKPFRNDEEFQFANCPDGELLEFPILSSGQVYGGGSPEAFRVIYQDTDDGNGKYCGLLYHP
ncbi:hypothetical protein LTS12_027950, partial [Elasticomyces elasticus]